jgi:hypothetical protein
MQPTTATLIVAALGIVGTFGAPIVTVYMNRSWQREEAIRDERLKEYRELLDALTESLQIELTWFEGVVFTPEQERAMVDVHSKTMRIIRNRLFVAVEVDSMNIEYQWGNALKAHYESMEVKPLTDAYLAIRAAIVSAALRERHRLKRRKAPRPGE